MLPVELFCVGIISRQSEYLEDLKISVVEKSKKIYYDCFAPKKEENESREENEWNQEPVKGRFLVADESVLAVGHVEQADVHDHHLDGLALNVFLTVANALIGPKFDDGHNARYYYDYRNQNLDFI